MKVGFIWEHLSDPGCLAVLGTLSILGSPRASCLTLYQKHIFLMDYNLFFLSFVNLATSEWLGWNNTQLSHFVFNVGSNAVGPNTELMCVLAIMLAVYPLLYYFV